MDLSTLDPFSPSAAPQADPSAPANSNIGSSWSNALNDPQTRTALLQFGISMLQPPSFGDTFGSQFGRSVGSAGEAVQRNVADARAQQDSDSKAALRESQANAAESRASTAAAHLGTAGAQLDLKRQQLSQGEERIGLTKLLGQQRRRIDASNAYNRYLAQAGQEKLISGKEPLSQEEFYSRFGFGDILSGGNDGSDPLEGKTATGPDGSRIIRRGGQWVPYSG